MKKLFTILAACLCVTSMWADRTFKLVTDVNDIDANGFYLFAQSYENSGTFNCLMGGYNSSSNRKGVAFTYQNELIVLQNAEIATSDVAADQVKAHVIRFVASENVSGAWNIYDVADGKYLDGGYVNSSKKNQNHLKAVSEPTTAGSTASNDGHFNITIDGEGVATIQNQKNFVVRLNPNISKGVATPIFASYPASGTTGTNVKIYREIVAEVAVSSAEYATYYNSASAYVMPANLEGITVTGVAGDALTLTTSYDAGDVVPAGEALILHGAEGPYTLYAGETLNSVVAENMLKGTDVAETTTGGVVYYGLGTGSNGVGFYWVVENGAAFTNGAHKAYLALPAGAPERLVFGENPVATDIENVATVKATKALVNGQLVIVRNGAKFNLNGMLVK